MAKRVVLWLALLGATAVAVVLGVPASRYTALGLLTGEPFYEGHPFSFWRNALQSRDPQVRRDAAFALGTMTEQAGAAAPDLGRALSDDNTLVRLNAALALIKIGPAGRAAVPELSAALKDRDAAVRMDAVLALARIGPDAAGAVPALTEALADPANRVCALTFSRSIQEESAFALGRIGPAAHSARPALVAALDDSDEDLRALAEEALRRIDPEEAADAPAGKAAGR